MATSPRYGIRGWQRLEEIYPARTHASEMLGLYANHASVVEAENFFSGIPKPDRITEWVVQSPEDFKFDVVLKRCSFKFLIVKSSKIEISIELVKSNPAFILFF